MNLKLIQKTRRQLLIDLIEMLISHVCTHQFLHPGFYQNDSSIQRMFENTKKWKSIDQMKCNFIETNAFLISPSEMECTVHSLLCTINLFKIDHFPWIHLICARCMENVNLAPFCTFIIAIVRRFIADGFRPR